MSEFTVGHLNELIQGLDDDISIVVLQGGSNYYIDDGVLCFNQGVANETSLSLSLKEVV